MQKIKWHPEILTAKQTHVLSIFGPIMKKLGYYLAGGTAAALYLGHRRSVDLDWFSPDEQKDPLTLAQKLSTHSGGVKVRDFSKGTLHAAIRGVRVSFFEYRYPLLLPPVVTGDFGCRVASLEDIACMKLVAVAQRGLKKDFLDIYAVCKRYKPLIELIELARKKFALEDISTILYGITYFEDADRENTPKTLWKTDWRRVKTEIKGWVRDIVEGSSIH